MEFELAAYFPIFLYLAAIVLFVAALLALTHLPLLKPHNGTATQLMPYESGMDPIGTTRQRFDVKFYLIAILFLVFDVEVLFLYPWAVVAYPARDEPAKLPAALGAIVFWEMIVFLATLAVAYVYAWRKGLFQWR